MGMMPMAQEAAATMCEHLAQEAATDQTSANELRILATNYLALVTTLEERLTTFTGWLDERSLIRAEIAEGNTSRAAEQIALNHQIKEFIKGSIPDQLYSSAFEFQHALNRILGQKVQMIFVWRDKRGHVETYEFEERELLKFDYNKLHQLTGRFANLNKQFKASLTPLEKTLIQNDQQEQWLAGLQSAFNETSWRYEHGTKGLVLFKDEAGNWVPFFVSAQGDINEGYAAALLSDMNNPENWGSDLEWQVYTFLMEYVANVDNQSGLLRGDITVGNIEYAVKSAGASTLGLTQLKVLAQTIVADPNYDINKLRALQRQLEMEARVRNGTLEMLQEAVGSIGAGLAGKIAGLDLAAELAAQVRQQ